VVPEKREERTTEGGLDLHNPTRNAFLAELSASARAAGIEVSFFIEPDEADLQTSRALGATAVELHTGGLCIAHQQQTSALDHEWSRYRAAVRVGNQLGLSVHAGHGIDYEIALELAQVGGVREYNIGHSIVCESVFCGIEEAARRMKAAIQPR
jgi:pyridoxine 5-phosphate synthase